jgi:U3 small nucleolar RNA-associated protein 14
MKSCRCAFSEAEARGELALHFCAAATMPPRIARSSVQTLAPKTAKNKNRKRPLDAYAIAGHQTQDRSRVAPHRLGESLDVNPRSKRRKISAGDDEDDGEAGLEEDAGLRRKLPRRRGQADAEVEEGSDSEGNEWTLGGLKEDDSDSDLDSDEAFGESDEEKFEGFAFRGSSSNKKPAKAQQRKRERGGEIDLDEEEGGESDDDEEEEEEEQEEDDFGDEGVDLATMLDDADEDMGAGEEGDEEDGSDEDDEGRSSEEESDDEDDEANDEERLAHLRDRVEAMDASNTSTVAAPAQNGVLSVDDLLADLDPTAKRQYAAALKTKKKSEKPKTLTAPLPKRQQDRLDREVASQKAKEQLGRWRDTVIHNRRAEFLAFPLQDPDRGEPIGKAKFDVQSAPQNELEENIRKIMEESGMAPKEGAKPADEEGDLMKAEELATNKLPLKEVMRRRAELRMARELLFREEIKAKRIAKIKSKSFRRVQRKQKEREAEIRQRELLNSDGEPEPMDEDGREKFERQRAEMRMGTKHKDSKWAKTLKATNRAVWDEGARDSVYEQARRQEELRRRIAGEDVGAGEDEGSDVPSDDDDDAPSDEDEDARTLRQLKKLQENGQGLGMKGVGNMKFMRAAAERQRKQNEDDVRQLRKELAVEDGDVEESDDEIDDQGLGRAIFGPQAKSQKKTEKKAKKAELEEGDDSADEDDEDLVLVDESGAAKEKPEQRSREPAPKKGILKKSGSGPLARGRSGSQTTSAPDQANDASSWLAAETGAKESEEASSAADWLTAENPAKKKKGKVDRQLQRAAAEDENIALDLAIEPGKATANAAAEEKKASKQDATITDTPAPAAAATAANAWHTIPHPSAGSPANEDENDDGSPEPEDLNPILPEPKGKKGQKKKAMSLKDRAFAGDDVEIAFQKEKADLVAEEEAKEIDPASQQLPGWGSWAGVEAEKRARFRSKGGKDDNNRKKHHPLYKNKAIPGKGRKAGSRPDWKAFAGEAETKDNKSHSNSNSKERRDAKKGMEKVIISEKQTERKGQKKFLAPELPKEFRDKKGEDSVGAGKMLYEGSLRVPLGPEFNAKVAFQRHTRPRVVVKRGTVVEAMERPLV